MKKLLVICLLSIITIVSSVSATENSALEMNILLYAPEGEQIVKYFFSNDEEQILVLTVKDQKGWYSENCDEEHFLNYYNINTGEIDKRINLGYIAGSNLVISNTQKYVAKYIKDSEKRKEHVELYTLPEFQLITTCHQDLYFGGLLVTMKNQLKFSLNDQYLIKDSYTKGKGSYWVGKQDRLSVYDINNHIEKSYFIEHSEQEVIDITNFWITPNSKNVFLVYFNEDLLQFTGTLLDLTTMKEDFTIKDNDVDNLFGGIYESIDFGDKRIVLSCYNSIFGYIIDSSSGNLVGDITGPVIPGTEDSRGVIKDICISEDGSSAAVSYGDQFVRLWDLKTGQKIQDINTNTMNTQIFLTNDDKTLIVNISYNLIENDGQLEFENKPPYFCLVYDKESGQLLKSIDDEKMGGLIKMSKSNHYMVTTGIQGDCIKELYIWDVRKVIN